MRSLSGPLLLMAAMGTGIGGCALSNTTSTVTSASDLGRLRVMQVRRSEGGDTTIGPLIASHLRRRGYEVFEDDTSGRQVDAVATHVDTWGWDPTPRLTELTITLRDPRSTYALATGRWLPASQTGPSPREMVDAVLDDIFDGTQARP